MTNAEYLIAAYVGVWLVHVAYLASLATRQKKVQEQIELLSERVKRGNA